MRKFLIPLLLFAALLAQPARAARISFPMTLPTVSANFPETWSFSEKGGVFTAFGSDESLGIVAMTTPSEDFSRAMAALKPVLDKMITGYQETTAFGRDPVVLNGFLARMADGKGRISGVELNIGMLVLSVKGRGRSTLLLTFGTEAAEKKHKDEIRLIINSLAPVKEISEIKEKSEKPRIAFFGTKPYDRQSFVVAGAEERFEVDWNEDRLTPQSAQLAKGHDAVCVSAADDLGRETLEALADYGVKLVALRCAEYNHVDLNAAGFRLGVVRVPAYSPHVTAEYALGMLLSLNRKFHLAHGQARENYPDIKNFPGTEIRGKTVGIIGTGETGRSFAGLLSGFGVKILAYDPFPDLQAATKYNWEYVGLDRLFAESDIISLHCAVNMLNFHLINAANIAKMKSGAILLNTSHINLIDTPAMIAGLKSGRIGGAGLEIYADPSASAGKEASMEKPLDNDVLTQLEAFPNVIVSAHQANFTSEELKNIANVTLKNIDEWLRTGNCANSLRPPGDLSVGPGAPDDPDDL